MSISIRFDIIILLFLISECFNVNTQRVSFGYQNIGSNVDTSANDYSLGSGASSSPLQTVQRNYATTVSNSNNGQKSGTNQQGYVASASLNRYQNSQDLETSYQSSKYNNIGSSTVSNNYQHNVESGFSKATSKPISSWDTSESRVGSTNVGFDPSRMMQTNQNSAFNSGYTSNTNINNSPGTYSKLNERRPTQGPTALTSNTNQNNRVLGSSVRMGSTVYESVDHNNENKITNYQNTRQAILGTPAQQEINSNLNQNYNGFDIEGSSGLKNSQVLSTQQSYTSGSISKLNQRDRPVRSTIRPSSPSDYATSQYSTEANRDINYGNSKPRNSVRTTTKYEENISNLHQSGNNGAVSQFLTQNPGHGNTNDNSINYKHNRQSQIEGPAEILLTDSSTNIYQGGSVEGSANSLQKVNDIKAGFGNINYQGSSQSIQKRPLRVPLEDSGYDNSNNNEISKNRIYNNNNQFQGTSSSSNVYQNNASTGSSIVYPQSLDSKTNNNHNNNNQNRGQSSFGRPTHQNTQEDRTSDTYSSHSSSSNKNENHSNRGSNNRNPSQQSQNSNKNVYSVSEVSEDLSNSSNQKNNRDSNQRNRDRNASNSNNKRNKNSSTGNLSSNESEEDSSYLRPNSKLRPIVNRGSSASIHRNTSTKKPVLSTFSQNNKNKNIIESKSNDRGGENPRGRSKGKKRISQIKYEQYLTSIFPDLDNKDVQEITDFNGRKLARPGQFPHVGAIGFKNRVLNKTEYKCGASLISETFAVTSAHCTDYNGLAPTYVRFGDLNLKAAEEDIDPQTRKIAQAISHPSYRDDSLYNDIALLQLEKPLIFTEFVQPIRLWYMDEIPFSKAYAMGFGAVEFAGAVTNRLTALDLTIIPNDSCAKQMPKQENAKRGIVDSQICAINYAKKETDTYQGDSGGPLQISFFGEEGGRQRDYLIGITSFGVVGANRLPGVYTRVSSFVDWIERTVWSSEYIPQ